MTEESIGSKLVTLLSQVITLYQSEAETETYPYATYEHNITPLRDKDGIYKYVAEGSVRIVSDDYTTGKQKAGSAVTQIETCTGPKYYARITSTDRYCVEGVWFFVINYKITQNS